jgi:hypothetical protein
MSTQKSEEVKRHFRDYLLVRSTIPQALLDHERQEYPVEWIEICLEVFGQPR